jgi:4-hydroxy-tetrahydrodipicolinate synthase
MAVRGILPVIPTPFRDSRFDTRSFERLLEHMLPSVDGYTLLGSTGEAPSLTSEARQEITAHALARTPADKSVVVGVTHTSIEESIALARHAQQHGAAGVLCASPFYFQNSTDGLRRFFAELDAALEVDLVLYDNPAATKTTLSGEDIIAWANELEHLGTLKLTDHDLSKVGQLQAAGMNVMAGDDPILFRYLDAGVDGVMVIAPAIFPEAFRDVWDALGSGDAAAAMQTFAAEILPFLHVFGIGNEIVTTKAMLKLMGIFDSDEVLPPLSPIDERWSALLDLSFTNTSSNSRTALS